MNNYKIMCKKRSLNYIFGKQILFDFNNINKLLKSNRKKLQVQNNKK